MPFNGPQIGFDYYHGCNILPSMITHRAWLSDEYQVGVDLTIGKDNTLVTYQPKEKTMKKYIMFVPNAEKSIEVQDRLIMAGFELIGDYRENCNFLEIDDGKIFHIAGFPTAARRIQSGHIVLNYENFNAFALDGAKKIIEVKGKKYTEDELQKMIDTFKLSKSLSVTLSTKNNKNYQLSKSNNTIVLKMVDDYGRFISNILGITEDGYLELYGCVDSNIGLQLDDHYKIKIKE